MIVFWTRWGILALFAPLLCFPLALFGAHFAGVKVGEWDEMSCLIGSAWMLSGLVCWFLGRILNRRKAGATDVRGPHTFLFMEMQWMGVLYGLPGLWFLAKSLWS